MADKLSRMPPANRRAAFAARHLSFGRHLVIRIPHAKRACIVFILRYFIDGGTCTLQCKTRSRSELMGPGFDPSPTVLSFPLLGTSLARWTSSFDPGDRMP